MWTVTASWSWRDPRWRRLSLRPCDERPSKWELSGIKQTTDVVTADIDGDGKPEFLAGLAAFKAIDQTHGRVFGRWTFPRRTRPSWRMWTEMDDVRS